MEIASIPTIENQQTPLMESVYRSMKWMIRNFVWEQYQMGRAEYSRELKEALEAFKVLAGELNKPVMFCPLCSYPMNRGDHACPVCNEDIERLYS